MKTKKTRIIITYIVLFALLLGAILLSLYIGSVSIAPRQVFSVLTGHGTDAKAMQIILSIRLPRVFAAAILGGALAVSGFLLQTFFRNPIAGPFVLGISSGAKLVVALAMIVGVSHGITMSSWFMIAMALIGSLLSMLFVLAVSKKVQEMSMLVVCGVMIGYICSAITDIAVTFADDSNIVNLHNWSLGSFAGISMAHVKIMTIVVVVAVAGSFLLSKPIGAYQMGESYAPASCDADFIIQLIIRLCDGIRRTDFVCRNRGATPCKECSKNNKADRDDSGQFSRRRCVLRAL